MKLNVNRSISFIESAKKRFLISFLFPLYIFIFLYVFTPFGVRDISSNKLIYLSGFFIITFTVLFFSFLLMPKIFKEWFVKWTVKKMVLFSLANFVIISILNWMYHRIFPVEFSESISMISFFLMTLSVGVFPFVLLIIYIKNITNRKGEKLGKTTTRTVLEKTDKELLIFSLNKKESFSCLLSQLLAIKSEGNYVSIYFVEKENFSKKLIHNSLINIEKQLKNYNLVIRCHRSFIVNCHHNYTIKGNRKTCSLQLKNLSFTIPVSRSFPKGTLEKLLAKNM